MLTETVELYIFNQMVNYLPQQTNEGQMNLIFHSLADPTRRKILQQLTKQTLTVSEVAKPYDMSLPAISKHLKVLEEANLIGREKKGREYTINLNPETLHTVAEYIAFYENFWNRKLHLLESFLEKGEKNE